MCEPGLVLPFADTATGDAGLEGLQRNRQPGQQRAAGGDDALLQPVQTDASKAEAPLPVGIQGCLKV